MIIKDIKLNNTMITPDGRTESFSYEEIENSQRTASGKLKKQIIARKKIINIEYEIINEDNLKPIYELYENTTNFISVELSDYDGNIVTFSANMGKPEFEKDFYGDDSKWYLTGFNFSLEEV